MGSSRLLVVESFMSSVYSLVGAAVDYLYIITKTLPSSVLLDSLIKKISHELGDYP